MKKTNILIPATLTTDTCLRIFVLDREAEVRYQPFDLDESYDQSIALKGGRLPSHKEIISIIKKESWKDTDPWTEGRSGSVMRANNAYSGIVFAYQIVITSTIEDHRKKFGGGHNNQTTDGTQEVLTKKVIILGELVPRAKIKRLTAWVRNQAKLPPGSRDDHGFQKRGVSFYTPMGARGIPWASKRPILKIGPATFVAIDWKTMEFHPLV